LDISLNIDLSRPPAILDIEASGFGKGSYPIEIGVASETGDTISWLIKPQIDWIHWKEEAAELHGITRIELIEKGNEPIDVANALNEQFEGRTLYSDGWGFDSGWLNLLFYVAGKSMFFKIETLPRILSEYQMENWELVKNDLRKKQRLGHHRAGVDAKLLQMTFQATARDEQLLKGNS